MTAHADVFAGHRPRLFGIAYRMLGSRADAEDVLQDAWLRWHDQDLDALKSTEAWLTTAVTRLSIDKLRAAKMQRETYFGPWLPEPLAQADLATPESLVERDSDLSIAFLNLLERLGHEERAAFVLHEVFDCDYEDIADTLGKSPAACRQMVHRARERIGSERRRFQVDEATRRRMLQRFIEAANRGDLAELKSIFAADAVLATDGGGKAVAATRVLHGAQRIARLWYAIARRYAGVGERRLVRINNELGVASYWNGKLHSVGTIVTDGARIHAYYSVANPDKLAAYAHIAKI